MCPTGLDCAIFTPTTFRLLVAFGRFRRLSPFKRRFVRSHCSLQTLYRVYNRVYKLRIQRPQRPVSKKLWNRLLNQPVESTDVQPPDSSGVGKSPSDIAELRVSKAASAEINYPPLISKRALFMPLIRWTQDGRRTHLQSSSTELQSSSISVSLSNNTFE